MTSILKEKSILFFLLSANVIFSQSKEPKLKIKHLTSDFYIYTTYKMYNGSPVSANGMYVLTDKGVVIIDSPWDETQFQLLLDSIQVKHHKNVLMCIATHSHEDRTGGLTYYKEKGIKTYTTKQTDEISKKQDGNRAEFLIEKDTVFSIGNHQFQTYYAGQGHAPDNIVIWFGKEKILYGGCFVKSIEATDLGYLGDANVVEWKKALEKTQNKFKTPNFIIPGHQRWDSTNSIKHTLKLIKEYNAAPKK